MCKNYVNSLITETRLFDADEEAVRRRRYDHHLSVPPYRIDDIEGIVSYNLVLDYYYFFDH